MNVHRNELGASSERLFKFAGTLAWSSMPPEIGRRASLAMLDTLGPALFVSQFPWEHMTADLACEQSADRPATVLGRTRGAQAMAAALANGTTRHESEIDAILPGAPVNPDAVVVSVVLAVAEATATSGKGILAGVVIGHDVMARLGLARGAEHTNRAFYTTSVAGPVAAGQKLHRLCAAVASGDQAVRIEGTDDPIVLSQPLRAAGTGEASSR